MDHVLEFRWTVSRGRNTYGYSICSLYVNGKKVAACNGGGYDMKGTSLGIWASDTFQERLQDIASRSHSNYWMKDGKYTKIDHEGDLYGMSVRWTDDTKDRKPDRVQLDGGCGFSSIQRILETIGVQMQWRGNQGQNRETYTLRDTIRSTDVK